MSRWDKEIWTPCRLGERFEYNDLGYRKVGWLAEVKADWMGQGGDHVAVGCKADCLRGYGNQRPCVLGLEPLPDGKCWTFEPRIRITPPEWIWDFDGAPADAFGLTLTKRDGTPRRIRLNSVSISFGRAVYVMAQVHGESFIVEHLPALDEYFSPIFPTTPMRHDIGTIWYFDEDKAENEKKEGMKNEHPGRRSHGDRAPAAAVR